MAAILFGAFKLEQEKTEKTGGSARLGGGVAAKTEVK